MNKVNFIIVEPSFLVRKGLVSIINEQPNTLVVREFENEQFNADLIISNGVRVIVINVDLFRNLHAEDIKKLTNKKNAPIIVALASSEAVPLGICKGLVSEVILLSDSKSVVTKKIRWIIGQFEQKTTDSSDNNELSDREIEILKDVAMGLSNKEIADKNFISPHTVITHRKNITRKLGIKTVSGLTIYAILNKFIGVDSME
jgi:DNA-binding NarL/FixJ family response regulator